MKVILKCQRLTLLWALFVFIMCSIKLGDAGKEKMFFPGFDKLVHCGFMFVLVVLTAGGIFRQQKITQLSYKTGISITLCAIIYGGALELLQEYVFTWRDGGWDDLFADSVGALMAALSILVIQKAIDYAKN